MAAAREKIKRANSQKAKDLKKKAAKKEENREKVVEVSKHNQEQRKDGEETYPKGDKGT